MPSEEKHIAGELHGRQADGSLEGADPRRWSERRVAVLGVLWFNAGAPCFSVMIIANSPEDVKGDEDFLAWRRHGFYRGGDSAVYHAIQFAIYRSVIAWKRGWMAYLNKNEATLNSVSKAEPSLLVLILTRGAESRSREPSSRRYYFRPTRRAAPYQGDSTRPGGSEP